MADIGKLRLEVETDAPKATAELNKLGDAADKAQGKAKGLSSSLKDVGRVGGDAADKTRGLSSVLGDLGRMGGPIGDIANKMDDLATRTGGATSAVSTLFGALGAGGTVVLGIVAGFVAVTAAIEVLAVKMGALADENDELAQKMGVTTQKLEVLKLIAAENGGTVEGLTAVYDKLSKSLTKLDEDNEKTAYSLKVLQIAQSELANKTQEEIAGIMIKRWEELGRTAKATAAVMQLLGPSFRSQVPAIKAMGESITEANDRVRKFGAEATPALVKAGGEQEKASKDLELAWKGLANQISLSASGMITTVTNWAASMLNSIRSVMKEWRDMNEVATAQTNAISGERMAAIRKQAKDEVFGAGGDPNATLGDVEKRVKQLVAQEMKANFQKSERDSYSSGVAAAAENIRVGKQQAASAAVQPRDKEAEAAAKKASAERQRYLELDMKGQVAFAQFMVEQNDKEVQDAADTAIAKLEIEKKNQADITRWQVQEAQRRTDANYDEAKALSDILIKQADESFEAIRKSGEFAFQSLSSALMDLVVSGEFNFKSFIASILKGLAQMLLQITILTPLMEAFKKSFSGASGGGWGSLLTNVVGAFGGGKAVGGPVSSGKTYLVGEKGPELFSPTSSGNIVPNHQLRSGGSSGGGVNVGSINISVQGGQTNAETGQVVSKAVLDAMKGIARTEIRASARTGGILNPV